MEPELADSMLRTRIEEARKAAKEHGHYQRQDQVAEILGISREGLMQASNPKRRRGLGISVWVKLLGMTGWPTVDMIEGVVLFLHSSPARVPSRLCAEAITALKAHDQGKLWTAIVRASVEEFDRTPYLDAVSGAISTAIESMQAALGGITQFEVADRIGVAREVLGSASNDYDERLTLGLGPLASILDHGTVPFGKRIDIVTTRACASNRPGLPALTKRLIAMWRRSAKDDDEVWKRISRLLAIEHRAYRASLSRRVMRGT